MSLIDPIMSPFLTMNPLLAVFILALLLSVFITVIYKYMTDQELMKTLKADIKAAQDEMKMFKDHPEKILNAQKKAMDKNMQYMMQSMKPTLITFIPLIFFFGWMNANLSYEPLHAGQEFSIDVMVKDNVYGSVMAIPPKMPNSIVLLESDPVKKVDSKILSYKFKAMTNGEWDVIFKVNNQTEYAKSVLIDDKKYVNPLQNKFTGKDLKQIKVGNTKKIVINLFGWKLGWLGTYIILSIIFSMTLRKLLKLH
jgi:uncharacterized membrane protein (DUF106 family)